MSFKTIRPEEVRKGLKVKYAGVPLTITDIWYRKMPDGKRQADVILLQHNSEFDAFYLHANHYTGCFDALVIADKEG